MTDTERIADGELAYHQHLAQRAQWAAITRAELAEIDGACQSWLKHLRNLYQLGPGDRVDDDGTIVRDPNAQADREALEQAEADAEAATAEKLASLRNGT